MNPNGTTILVTLIGTVVMFSALPMLVSARWHHRSLKFNIGKERTQLFVGIWVLQGVSQLNVTRIVVPCSIVKVFYLFGEFDYVRFLNPIEVNRTTEFDYRTLC